LVALERGASASEDPVWQPVSEAVELLIAVARVGANFGKPGIDSRGRVADQLSRRLACHEQAVLAGEVTYNVWPEQADQPEPDRVPRITGLVGCLGGCWC
jgi:hypothetical protein